LFETTTISPTTPAGSNPFLFSCNDTNEHEMMTTKMKTTMNPTQQLQQGQQQWQYNNGRAMDAMMATTMQSTPFHPPLVWNDDYLSNHWMMTTTTPT
jgi:hypothetical protein